MKTIALVLFICFALSSQAQEKVNAMGEINFGDTKQEARKAFKKDKQSYYFEFGDNVFTPTFIGSKFMPGLQRLTFKHSIKGGATGCDDKQSAQLCLQMEEYFKNKGGNVTYYNPNYPTAKNMLGATVFIVELDGKMYRPYVNTTIESSKRVWEYVFGIDIMSIDYYNSKALQYKSYSKK